VKDVGEPCAGEPHARFDGEGLETEQPPPRQPLTQPSSATEPRPSSVAGGAAPAMQAAEWSGHAGPSVPLVGSCKLVSQTTSVRRPISRLTRSSGLVKRSLERCAAKNCPSRGAALRNRALFHRPDRVEPAQLVVDVGDENDGGMPGEELAHHRRATAARTADEVRQGQASRVPPGTVATPRGPGKGCSP
jgi:hypothetical protein